MSFTVLHFRAIGLNTEILLRKSPYSVRMPETTEQKNSEYRQLLRSVKIYFRSLFQSFSQKLVLFLCSYEMASPVRFVLWPFPQISAPYYLTLQTTHHTSLWFDLIRISYTFWIYIKFHHIEINKLFESFCNFTFKCA